MTLKQLRLLMCDSIKNPTLPPYRYGNRKRFAEISCRKWAIQELYEYCQLGIYPKKEATISMYYDIAFHFKRMMLRFANEDPKEAWRFNIAAEVASDLIDILCAIVC